MHMHSSFVDAFLTFAQVIIFAFFWRVLSAYGHDRPWGKAMAFIF